MHQTVDKSVLLPTQMISWLTFWKKFLGPVHHIVLVHKLESCIAEVVQWPFSNAFVSYCLLIVFGCLFYKVRLLCVVSCVIWQVMILVYVYQARTAPTHVSTIFICSVLEMPPFPEVGACLFQFQACSLTQAFTGCSTSRARNPLLGSWF